MIEILFSAPEETAPAVCPACGARARVHARQTRAIYDWEVTFVDCLRLDCCGRTFTTSPAGLTLRARYSDRVVALARALAAVGLSTRQIARLMKAARVPLTAECVRGWCRGVAPLVSGVAASLNGVGDVFVRLRAGTVLTLRGADPQRILNAFLREGARLHRIEQAA